MPPGWASGPWPVTLRLLRNPGQHHHPVNLRFLQHTLQEPSLSQLPDTQAPWAELGSRVGAPHSKDGSINAPRVPDTFRETWNLWPPALFSQCADKLTWEVEELGYGIPTLAGHPLDYEPGQVTALWAFASRMSHGHLEINLSEQTITPANPAPEPPFPSQALLSAPRPQPATSPRAPEGSLASSLCSHCTPPCSVTKFSGFMSYMSPYPEHHGPNQAHISPHLSQSLPGLSSLIPVSSQ